MLPSGVAEDQSEFSPKHRLPAALGTQLDVNRRAGPTALEPGGNVACGGNCALARAGAKSAAIRARLGVWFFKRANSSTLDESLRARNRLARR